MNRFIELAKVNVNEHTEQKNGLTYLSWAWAVDQLMRADPEANWAYPDPKLYGETVMVYCTVTAFGKAMTAHLPVMDYRNKPIPGPNAFEMNTAMQRCLVKAIALHGLGLYLYAGEDLPLGSEEVKGETVKQDKGEVEKTVLDFRTALALDADESEIAEMVWAIHSRVATNSDLYIAIGEVLNSKERNAIKAYVTQHKNAAKHAPVDMRGR